MQIYTFFYIVHPCSERENILHFSLNIMKLFVCFLLHHQPPGGYALAGVYLHYITAC